LIVVVDCLRRRKRTTAGEAQATVSFGCPMLCSILCGIWQKKIIRESAGEKGKDWERNEDADSPVVLDFEREWPLASAGSGEIFQQPWGVSGTGGRGEMERMGRASYRRGLVTKWAGY
jgi:hypothetical protein